MNAVVGLSAGRGLRKGEIPAAPFITRQANARIAGTIHTVTGASCLSVCGYCPEQKDEVVRPHVGYVWVRSNTYRKWNLGLRHSQGLTFIYTIFSGCV